ncbi:MAG TPA: hypothetical protein ENO22_11110 [candidate division Zixibacteria bacterium]|nr:hypothetical protein [candidate division Zixibacteria bacterium]HEQ99875.1 hypothetical protein [candidate division Zixibacteria bacterium]
MSIETLIAAVLTLAIFSFLYKENPFYRAAEHLLVGVSVGYYLVILVEETIWSKVARPLAYDQNWIVIIPAVLGLMMFLRLSRNRAYLTRIPLALLIGAGAGVSIPAMLWARVLKQMSASMLPLYTVSGMIVLVGVITTIIYFYFSREQEGWFGYLAKTGTYFLMVFFGATFGYTVMSRVTLLIGRMEFLLTDFLGVVG